ncbi:MAG: hypothetical protein PVI40_08220 [Chlamydiota bacterium]|jgi:hypothetical protein
MANVVTSKIPFFPGFMEHTLTFLETKDQSAVQRTCRAWCKSSLSNPGRYAQMKSIASLSNEEITKLEDNGFPFAEFFKEKFISNRLTMDKVNPCNAISKEYLTEVLRAKCRRDPHEMLSFLISLSPEVRSSIQFLDLNNRKLTGAYVAQVLILCPNLEALDITSSFLTNIHLPEGYKNTKLRKISLDFCYHRVDEESFQLFFQKMASLEDLSIECLRATGNMLLGLNPSHFKKLKMSCCSNLNQGTLGAFFRTHAKLEELNIEDSNVSLFALEQIPINNKLKKLILNTSSLEKALDEQLTFLFSKLKELEELNLTGFDITGSALLALDASKLKSLRLVACLEIDIKILEIFFKKLKNLELLELTNTEITESVLKALDPSKLKALRLWSDITDEDLSEFFAKAVLLEKLDLAQTDTTGLSLLSLNISILKELTLNSCEKIDENILSKVLTKIVNLEKLDLSDTYIYGECLQNVEPYQLKELHVYGCRNLDVNYIKKFPDRIILK